MKKKAMMVILDGLIDQEIAELDDQSSFAYAKHPNLDRLASAGWQGYIDACPAGYTPESMVCILNLLGVEKQYFPSSRAGLELKSLGYPLAEDEVVLRCNLIAIDSENRLVSFNGGLLSKEKMEKAASLIKEATPDASLLPMAEYRNLLVLKKKDFTRLEVTTYPPHECLGENVEELLAEICAYSPKIADFVSQSFQGLQGFKQAGETYGFYPWGISGRDLLPSFEQKYKRRAAAVGGADIVRGIALAMGMEVPKLRGVTGDTDTDLQMKAETACTLQADHDFVLVHINGTDEASHRKDYPEKVRFIERIDREFMANLLENAEPGTRIMICADHATLPTTGKHAHLPVPLILAEIGEIAEFAQTKRMEESYLNRSKEVLTPKDALHWLVAIEEAL